MMLTHRAMALIAFAVLATPGPALSHETVAGALFIDHPIARETPSAKTPGGAYMTIRNNGDKPDRLVAARTPAAGRGEFHQSIIDGDIVRMRPLPAIDLPPAGSVALQPGKGMHLMLMDLAERLKRGDSFPMTLTFERGGDVEITIRVTAITGAAGGHHQPDTQ